MAAIGQFDADPDASEALRQTWGADYSRPMNAAKRNFAWLPAAVRRAATAVGLDAAHQFIGLLVNLGKK
jgi:4-alpha-glucanotransferase